MSKKRRRHQKNQPDAVSKPHAQPTANEVAQAIKNITLQHARMMQQLQIEDRRKHHPDGRNRPLKTTRGTRLPPHQLKTTKKISVRRGPHGRPLKSKTVRVRTLTARLKFAAPKKTMICIKRKIRREVLLAFGRGGGRHKNPKRNRHSEVSC